MLAFWLCACVRGVHVRAREAVRALRPAPCRALARTRVAGRRWQVIAPVSSDPTGKSPAAWTGTADRLSARLTARQGLPRRPSSQHAHSPASWLPSHSADTPVWLHAAEMETAASSADADPIARFEALLDERLSRKSTGKPRCIFCCGGVSTARRRVPFACVDIAQPTRHRAAWSAHHLSRGLASSAGCPTHARTRREQAKGSHFESRQRTFTPCGKR